MLNLTHYYKPARTLFRLGQKTSFGMAEALGTKIMHQTLPGNCHGSN